MENSVVSAIELIKQQEQEKEAKLKEKREFETTLASLNRSIRDASLKIENLKQEECELLKRNDNLRAKLQVERIRRDALNMQIEACTKELYELQIKCEQGISAVWELRSSLCDAVQKASDDCDIWALLMKPMCLDIPRSLKKPNEISEYKSVSEEQLKNALEKREKIALERNRLMVEPDVGEEFVRIKNALRYSLEMIEKWEK